MAKTGENRENEKVLVSIPELLVKKLNEEKGKRGYGSVQVIINEAIRERYFGKRMSGHGGAKRGPKPKFEHEAIMFGSNFKK